MINIGSLCVIYACFRVRELSWCGTFIVSCYVFVYIPDSIFFVDECSALYARVFISKEMRVFVHMFTHR